MTESIELVAPIAEGAMGRVWVAYHHRLKTRVAVKFVHEKLGTDNVAEAIKRFEHEASTASQIKSPHVVQTFDSGVTPEGVPYMVMELLEGQSLGERLRSQEPLGWSEAATVLAQVARALTKAHELGIVHRDIKPDNIFLCRADDGVHCKILDFGIAKQTRLPAMGGLTTDGKIVGTPEFMSPEMVLEDRPVDYCTDLWALGVVMYVAITGQLPYSGKTLGQLCLNLVHKKPRAPSELRKDLPPGADAWFARALHQKPRERFSSSREMALSFAAVLGGTTAHSDLVSATLAIHLDTERQFAAAADPPTTIRQRKLTRTFKGALALAGVGVVGLSVAVLSHSAERPQEVRSLAAARAVEVASGLAPPSAQAPEPSAAPRAAPEPVATPAVAGRAAATPSATVAGSTAKPAVPPSGAKPVDHTRGPEATGF